MGRTIFQGSVQVFGTWSFYKSLRYWFEMSQAVGVTQKIRLSSPRFHAFLLGQFLGAANDNAFKITITILVLRLIDGELEQLKLNSQIGALMPIAYLLFSPMAGWLADRFRKHRV